MENQRHPKGHKTINIIKGSWTYKVEYTSGVKLKDGTGKDSKSQITNRVAWSGQLIKGN